MKVAATGYYVKASDQIVISAWFSTGTKLFTKHVESSKILVFCEPSSTPSYTIEFDRRMGNSDGSFKFCILHPTNYLGLRGELIGIVAMETGNEEFRASFNIQLVDTEDEAPLAANPVSTNPEYRTKKIIAEQT